jgi:hypothetical protein
VLRGISAVSELGGKQPSESPVVAARVEVAGHDLLPGGAGERG